MRKKIRKKNQLDNKTNFVTCAARRLDAAKKKKNIMANSGDCR